MLYCSIHPMHALYIARFAYSGVVFIPTLFVHFMLEFLRLKKSNVIRMTYVCSFAFLILVQFDVFMDGVRLYFWGFYPKAGPMYWLFMVYFYAAFGYCVLCFSLAYFKIRKSKEAASIHAQQLKYVFWANCAACVSITDYITKYGLEIYPWAYLSAMAWLALMAYAILKFRLMDIQLVVRKTLIYSLVSAVLTAVYFLVVTICANVSSGWIGQTSLISIAVAGVAVTLIFMPLFKRIQSMIDKLFFRFRIDRETQLVEFSSKIIQQETTEHLTQSIRQVLEDSLHPKVMGFYLQTIGSGDYLEITGKAPEGWGKSLPADNLWARTFRSDSHPIVRDDLSMDMRLWDVQAAVPLMSQGDVLGFFLLGEKLSEEPYTNEDLILLRIVANQATVAYERPKLLREVSGGFVHEVKTPISKISLPAELTYLEIEEAIKRGINSSDGLLQKIQQRMKYIMDQAFLASHRVEALQQLGSETGLVREAIFLPNLIQSSIQSLGELFSQTKTELITQIPNDLPVISGNAKQLEIVFVNLLKNAVESLALCATDQSRRITLNASSTSSDVSVRVVDTGMGISEKAKERIFQPHFTTKAHHGAGMGLFLCRQIIKRHAGSLDVISSLGQGAQFTVVLPLRA